MEHSITVIITIWKRNYLNEQLASLVQQTILPNSVIILQNEVTFNCETIISTWKASFEQLYLIKSDINLTSTGRFLIGTLCRSAYTLYLDDDIIPGTNWLEICLEKCHIYNSIVSCTGRIIPYNDFTPEIWKSTDHSKYFIGDCYNNLDYNYCPNDTYVDYGCNSYFIKSKWTEWFWSVWPSSFKSIEDIHLSAILMLKNSIPTIVPKQIGIEMSGNLKKNYGNDKFASWKTAEFINNRENCLRYLIEKKGWKPILWG